MSNQHELIYWLGSGVISGPDFVEVIEESCQNNPSKHKILYKRNGALRMNWLYTIDKKPVYLNTGVAPLARLIFSYPKEFKEYCDIHCYLIDGKNGLLLACNKYLKLESGSKHFSYENYRRQKSGAKFFQWRIDISKIKRYSSITLCRSNKKNEQESSDKRERATHSDGIKNLSNVSKKRTKIKLTKSVDSGSSDKQPSKIPMKSYTTEIKDDVLDSYSKWLIDMNKKPSKKTDLNNKDDEKRRPVYDDLDELIDKVDDLEIKDDKSIRTEEGSVPINKNSAVEKEYDKDKKSPTPM